MTQRIDPITRAELQRVADDLTRNAGGIKAWRVGNKQALAIEFRADRFTDAERAARDWFEERRRLCEERKFTVHPVITYSREGLAAISAAERIRQLIEAAAPDESDEIAVNTEGGCGARPWVLHVHQGEEHGNQEAQGR